ncbi:MAG TPA: ABC transporter substrate-binding protein [Acidobacteriota bacterium]|nr:ABC transporter substrate-binding protein [Acidobacteriota bacterium]
MLAWLLTAILAFVAQQPSKPYADFSDKGSGFYGAGREVPDPVDLKTVRIGVLAPEKNPEGLQIRNAVQMALDEVNRKGGYHGIPYEMVFRADDGPWGVAAQRVVDLAYEDKVWTIIGGLDGQRTHVAELVVSKAWVPVISPAATDTSVDYANVPWVFRCPPADSHQADLLIGYAQKQGYKHVVVLTELQRDGHTGYLRLQDKADQRHFSFEAHYEFPAANPEQVVPRLKETELDAVILWGSAAPALSLLRALRTSGISVPVLAPSMLAVPETAAGAAWVGNLVVSAPCDLSRQDPAATAFSDRFSTRWGVQPSPVAFFSYDAARMVIRAIELTGLNRMRIRDELTQISFDGLAGKIQFNSLRGNTAEPYLLTLKAGKWRRLE